jgi:hypothetical protein
MFEISWNVSEEERTELGLKYIDLMMLGEI